MTGGAQVREPVGVRAMLGLVLGSFAVALAACASSGSEPIPTTPHPPTTLGERLESGGEPIPPPGDVPGTTMPAPIPPASITPQGEGLAIVVPEIDTPPPREVVDPIEIQGRSNVVIENVQISNPTGPCISISDSGNVTIRNSTIGPCGGDAVYLSDVDDVEVTGNYITDSKNGVMAHRSMSIVVDGNVFVNAGRNYVQFDKILGPGSSISGNRGESDLGGTRVEDMISVYKSEGTEDSPIQISSNRLRNGGPSDTGSGIMLGDGGGAYQVAEGNNLVDPGQVGIGVAGGDNIRVLDNVVYSEAQPWSNVGVYTWDFGDGCGAVEISGNSIDWTSSSGVSNGYWDGGGCDVTEYDNNWNATLGPDIW